ncbi:hypothetical protein HYH03_002972 [Edaphochlamys debaryana]|uniref:Uncharacterized protein n=1 Tax=Edaphochlamys debaryana TaxID=47281 RepID=A0A835YB24_9CHLO|nr:hypothetical protein HYH03_002972 [Edaphochlamys debaryana]|eukprot:KAG2499398.1 hypothetical protein HYH03_002972 [Edaphochlamys debaryana]
MWSAEERAVSTVEDLILLSRYDEACAAVQPLVQRLMGSGGPAAALLQRALVASFQAHFFTGRQAELEKQIEELGMERLTVPTFLSWALLLLESGRAAEARARVERYMAAVVSLLEHQQQQRGIKGLILQPQPWNHHRRDQSCKAKQSSGLLHPLQTDCPDDQHAEYGALHANSHIGDLELPCACHAYSIAYASPLSPGAGAGAGAATVHDRLALARLYSQDILCMGLESEGDALAWLEPGGASRRSLLKVAGEPGQAGGVVTARSLLGCEEAVSRLRKELESLLQAVGRWPMSPPPGRSRSSSLAGSPPSASAKQAPAAAVAAAVAAAAAAGQGPAFPSATTAAAGSAPGAGAVGPARRAPRPLPHSAGAFWVAALRAFLTIAGRYLARLMRAARQGIGRGAAWTVCAVLSAASRLRQASARSPAATRWALRLLLAVVVVVAARAEAHNVRSAVAAPLAAAAAAVREALGMGLAMNPSPVATAVSSMASAMLQGAH